MSKPKEEEDFEFDESVSSNLSFLNDEDTRDKQPTQVGKQEPEELKEAKKKNDKDASETLNKGGKQPNEESKKREQSARSQQQQQQQQAEEDDSEDNNKVPLSDAEEEDRTKDKEGPKKRTASGGARRGKSGNPRSGNGRGGAKPGQKRKQNNQKDTAKDVDDHEMDLNDTHEAENDENGENNDHDNIEDEEEEKQQTKALGAKKLASPTKFFLYREGVKLPDLSDLLNQSIEVRISKEYINKQNREVQSRNAWGCDNYTSDSDIVCMLLHHGLLRLDMVQLKPESIYTGVKAMIKVSKNRKTYSSVEKHGIISRPSKTYAGYTIKPESIGFIQTLGTPDELLRNAGLMSQPRKKLKHNNWMNPRNLVGIPEASIVFDLSNEPAFKYSIVNFCDKSEESMDWMSQRLKKEVLYLETDNERYEISKVSEAEMIIVNEYDAYKIAKVNEPYQLDNLAMSKLAVPLSAEHITLIFKDIDWSEFLWGSHCLKLKDITINNLKTYKLFPRNRD